MTADFQKLLDSLAIYDQQHLLRFWDRLTADQRLGLASQIEAIDFARIQAEWQRTVAETNWAQLAERATSPDAVRLGESNSRFDVIEARAVGERALRDGRVAVVVVAGGQGTRLGFDQPKGMYPIGPVSQRSLFEIHADRIAAVGHGYHQPIHWYIMTSPATHEETIHYFQSNSFLGLSAEQVTFFCQGTMPALDADSGKLLLESPSRIFLSPDGHGGTLAALQRGGCLQEMRDANVDYLFYFQVDNPLVAIADPQIIGYHILAGSELTSQVVAKHDPLEKVGNIVSVDGQLHVIEYSDLSEEAAKRTNPDGSLAIWAGSIAVHVFNTDFLCRMAADQSSLPFHHALKTVPIVDNDGRQVSPTQPNAIKLETFIFDLLPKARHALVVEVDEAQAFAPLKNASGAAKDTPETCQAAIASLHRRWLRSAGVDVADNVVVEINPKFAMDESELKQKLPAGTRIMHSQYFSSNYPK